MSKSDIAITVAVGFLVALIAVVAVQDVLVWVLLVGLATSTTAAVVLRRRENAPRQIYLGTATWLQEIPAGAVVQDTGPLSVDEYDVDAYWSAEPGAAPGASTPSYELQHRDAANETDRRAVLLGSGQLRWPGVQIEPGERFRIVVRKPGVGRGLTQSYLSVRRSSPKGA